MTCSGTGTRPRTGRSCSRTGDVRIWVLTHTLSGLVCPTRDRDLDGQTKGKTCVSEARPLNTIFFVRP